MTNSFTKAIADAAAQIDMNVADRSDATPQEMAAHRKAMHDRIWQAAKKEEQRYKAEHPETARVYVDIIGARIAKPRPPGLTAAVTSRVENGFDSPDSIASNREIVESINRQIGSSFSPDNYLNGRLAAPERRAIAAIFKRRGVYFDSSRIESLSDVFKAVKASKVSAKGRPFTTAGKRTEDKLTLAGRTYRIERHNGHECVRLTIGGKQLRFRLDALATLVDGLVDPSHSIGINTFREVAPNAEIGSVDGVDNEAGTSSRNPVDPLELYL
jgi:hypothetical protein